MDGVFNSCVAAYPYMKQHQRGKIIMMASIAAFTGFGMQVCVCVFCWWGGGWGLEQSGYHVACCLAGCCHAHPSP